MLRFVLISSLLVSVLAAQPATPPVAAPSPDPAAPLRVGVSITERRLTLQEAIEMALANNLDIEIERTNLATAEQSVQAARGFFDPAFRWAPIFENRNTPVANVFQGAGGRLEDRFVSSNLSLRQKLQNWGTIGRVEFSNYRQTTTNPFTNFNPTLTSQFLIGVNQPLVRGFRIDPERAELRIRKKRVDLSNVDLETRSIDVITSTQQAYYDLVAAREAVQVAQESAELAREQLAINQRMVKAGTLAPVEIAAAEAEYQRRIDTWHATIGQVTEAENRLKLLIAPERAASIWSDQIIPTDVNTLEPPVQEVYEGVQIALKQRPELRALGVRREINDVEKDLNANLKKPEINLVAQYSLNGLAGTENRTPNPLGNLNAPLYDRLNQLSVAQGLQPVPAPSFGGTPGFLVGNLGTALSNMGRYQSFQVGVAIDLNLRNRTAEANYGQTLINEKRLRLERARIEQGIEAQVRNALQGIQTARQRIAAAEASARAAKEKLDSEIRLYQTGESTNFLVLTRQNEYANSRVRSVVARLELNKNVALLEQALGTTLSTHRISVR